MAAANSLSTLDCDNCNCEKFYIVPTTKLEVSSIDQRIVIVCENYLKESPMDPSEFELDTLTKVTRCGDCSCVDFYQVVWTAELPDDGDRIVYCCERNKNAFFEDLSVKKVKKICKITP